ncbi:MAG TPA: Rrf2 family transcriptional regulator [Armatimonadota bacterium]|nr:Rrf2 family transcriptional regulator [Armatimonadota bacterium]
MIRLNLATDFALRTLLYVASRPEGWVSTRAVAEFYGISHDHVAKVAQTLTHAGYLRAGRGRTGGVQLARTPEEISVGDVVELFEGPVALLDCVTRQEVCVIQPGCRLRRLLEDAGARLIRELKAVSLAELVPPAGAGLVQLTVGFDRSAAPVGAALATGLDKEPPLE